MRTFVEDIKHGQRISDIWAVGKCDERDSRNGREFLCFEFVDRTGTMKGHHWNPSPYEREAACEMEFALVSGTFDKEWGVKFAQFPQTVPAPDDLNPFLRLSPVPVAELTRRFEVLKQQVGQPQLAALLEKLLGEGGIVRALYWEAPAAIRNHHAFRHGLLHHSVEVAEMALVMHDTCPGPHPSPFRRDLLITGALLHDIGKVREIKNGAACYDFSLAGHLLGHTTLGVATVSALFGKTLASPLRELLLHLIASHHGKYEFGAPSLPQTREALLLHKADALSAELFYADAAQTKAKPFDIKRGFAEAPLLPTKRIFVGDYGFMASEKPQTQNAPILPTELWKLVCPWHGNEAALVCADTENRFATVRLPLLARAAAGPGIYTEADLEGHFTVTAWAKEVTDTSHYLLTVSGDSMTRAGICDGDRLVVQAARQANHDEVVVVTLPDGAVTIKRLERLAKGAVLHAESVETVYPSPFVPHGTDFRIEGVAVGVLRPA